LQAPFIVKLNALFCREERFLIKTWTEFLILYCSLVILRASTCSSSNSTPSSETVDEFTFGSIEAGRWELIFVCFELLAALDLDRELASAALDFFLLSEAS
jgi:hypothetical protein